MRRDQTVRRSLEELDCRRGWGHRKMTGHADRARAPTLSGIMEGIVLREGDLRQKKTHRQQAAEPLEEQPSIIATRRLHVPDEYMRVEMSHDHTALRSGQQPETTKCFARLRAVCYIAARERHGVTPDETIRHRLAVATRHLQAGENGTAARECESILEAHPEQPEALGMLGVLRGMAGDAEAARELLLRANELRPGSPRLLNSLAMACMETGDLPAAERWLRGCLKRVPGFAPAWYTLALTKEQQRDLHAAVSCYERTLALDPGFADAWSNLAQIRERLNQLQLAGEAAGRALALDPANVVARLTAAQVDGRLGRHQSARERLESMIEDGTLGTTNEAIVRSRLADSLDALDLPDEAFAQYAAANRIQARTAEAAYQIDAGPYSLDAVRRLATAIDRLADHAVGTPEPETEGPFFLLGFPRSGTTLLDRMLSAHPAVESIEEQETLADAQRDFVLAHGGLDRLRHITEAVRSGYVDAYRRRVADAGAGRSPVVLDKLPLHSIFLPVISAVFPDARVIFVIRDPRDVCLSCFMQRFELNTAMAHFLDLELTAEYYVAVMELALDSLDRLPIRHLRVRYEDLVTDPAPNLRDLIGFMGLDWDPAVLDYRSRIEGSKIDTPSYRQVSRPLYRSSIGRWRRYEEQLEPIRETLAPLVSRLGYD